MFLMLDLPAPDSTQPQPATPFQEVERVSPHKRRAAARRATKPDCEVPPLQFGDFTLGDADCPSLTGHPNIRY